MATDGKVHSLVNAKHNTRNTFLRFLFILAVKVSRVSVCVKQCVKRTLPQSIRLSVMLTYGDGVGVAFVVDAEPPQALIGRAARVAILHPEVGRCGNDEKHKGSHAAERASPRQRVEHGVRECSTSSVSNC